MSATEKYVACSSLPVSVEEAFAYHDRRGALERLIPPWESVQIESSDQSLVVGSQVVMKVRIAGIPIRWVAQHTQYDRPHQFADTQVSGPFAAWDHLHQFQQAGSYSLLRDSITYRIPLGLAGRFFGGGKVQKTLEAMFAFRHRVTRDDLTLQADHPCDPMSVAISGTTGLIGGQLASLLTLLGHKVRPIVRSPSPLPDTIAAWNSEADAKKLGEVDAVVHLAGKSIASGRWTEASKKEMVDSRVRKTRQLCESLASAERKPTVLVCASATGIYGDRGDELLDEQSAVGSGFLAEVASQWEAACRPAVEAGIRVVHARLGIVLSPQGGALAKMLLPANLAAGSLGSGQQWWSWIALDDALGAIYHAITTPGLQGAVNFVSPQPCTNRDFASVLGEVVRRPALIPAPAFLLRAVMGEMADSLLLTSARVAPTRLAESNYKYRFTDLGEALRYYLGRERLQSSE